ncbi:MAG: hypothetical protein NTW50_01465 [Candidatus Berkelbacteria bacterium]|nr:hypothetical protein [Candidatus Berkelbacteria bacterium]
MLKDLITKTYAYNFSALRVGYNANKNVTVDGIVSIVIQWVSIIGGVVALAYLIYSGFLYLTAAGNPDHTKKGSQGILWSIVGIIVLSLTYVIFSVIRGEIS